MQIVRNVWPWHRTLKKLNCVIDCLTDVLKPSISFGTFEEKYVDHVNTALRS